MTDNYSKENYITRDPTVLAWKDHPNVRILSVYQEYITGDVLDIGCNHGASGTYWLSDNAAVSTITGVDIQPTVEVLFREVMSPVAIPVYFISESFARYITPTKLYDTAVSFHTLEHIWPDDVSVFITNIFNHLKSGGTFIISIPYELSYSDPTHVGTYNEHSLKQLCESSGFSTIECIKDGRWPLHNLLTAVFTK
jgi:2-polyprenyl-3-methyl-5-hydroxy-6-metoxy-1,4-benzoquinol methylase